MSSRPAELVEIGPASGARVPFAHAVGSPEPSSPPASFGPLKMNTLMGPTPLQEKHDVIESSTGAKQGEARAARPVGNVNGSCPEEDLDARTTRSHPGETPAKGNQGGSSRQSNDDQWSGVIEEESGDGKRVSGRMIGNRPDGDLRRVAGGTVEEAVAVIEAANYSPGRICNRHDKKEDPPADDGSGGSSMPPSVPTPEIFPASLKESIPAKHDDTGAFFFIGEDEGGVDEGEGHGDGDANGDAGGGYDRATDKDPMGPASGPTEGEKSQTVPGKEEGAGGGPSPGGAKNAGGGGSSSSVGMENENPLIRKAVSVDGGIGEGAGTVSSPKLVVLLNPRLSRSTTDLENLKPPSLLRPASKYQHEDLAEAKRKQSMRTRTRRQKKLSFADEHGDSLHTTEFQQGLYYSREGVPTPRGGRGCCTVS